MRHRTVTSDHGVYAFFGESCYTVQGEVFR